MRRSRCPLVATDPDGDAVTLQRDGLAAGLTIAPTTGVITGTLTYTSAGTHPVTVTVSDGDADDGSQTFTWTVTNVNRAPALTAVRDQTDAGARVGRARRCVASDPDGDDADLQRDRPARRASRSTPRPA